MINEAETHADEAHRLREAVDTKNMAETLAYQTERTLKEHRDKIDESEASTIDGRIMELRQALEGDVIVADIRAKAESLQEAPAQARRGGLRAGDRAGAGIRRRATVLPRPTKRSSRKARPKT